MPPLNHNPASSEHTGDPSHQDGLEILLNMTKTGQVDPWNIDIVQVADEYLKAVADLKASDLRITGKILLYLAILLRMKSDKLAGIHYLDPLPAEDDFFDALMDGELMLDGPDIKQKLLPYDSLDELIQRRTSTKQKRIRRVTLLDLIQELKRYEALEAKRSLRQKIETDDQRRMTDYSHLTADDIEELAHEEFLEETILKLTHILERLLVQNEQVSLTELTDEGQIDKVSAFLALLFLSARGAVQMHQEVFYSELYVSLDDLTDPQDVVDDLDQAPLDKAS